MRSLYEEPWEERLYREMKQNALLRDYIGKATHFARQGDIDTTQEYLKKAAKIEKEPAFEAHEEINRQAYMNYYSSHPTSKLAGQYTAAIGISVLALASILFFRRLVRR